MNKEYGQKEQALIDLCSQNPLDMESFTYCLRDGVDVSEKQKTLMTEKTYMMSAAILKN